MPPLAPSDHQQQPDYIFVGVLCVCALIIPVPVAVGVSSLQRLLQPADSVLFGPTPNGELMFAIPTILIGILASFRVARTLTRRIRRGLRMPDKDLLPDGAWAKSIDWQSINWRPAAGIAGVILMLVAAKGLGSYSYVTESGVSVRSPLEFSMRHYEWKDVTTVRVHCRDSMSKRKRRFRYVLEMSNGQEVDLSRALYGASAKLRAASAVRFAEFIPSHLNAVPSIRYEFDVSQAALVSLGKKHGVVLSKALSEQILAHGGTLQR
jgi:hypothetical protein